MMGNNRNADGTVDRSPPPPPTVKKLLKEIKRGIAIGRYGIDIHGPGDPGAGGIAVNEPYGTITNSRFNSVMTTKQEYFFRLWRLSWNACNAREGDLTMSFHTIDHASSPSLVRTSGQQQQQLVHSTVTPG